MNGDIFELIRVNNSRDELTAILLCNEGTGRFGLSLTEEEAGELMACRNESLKRFNRVEFGRGILDKLIFAFCDSQYINQEAYLESMEQLQDIFYEFKNESEDKLTDDELLNFMKEQFETVCYGDLEYLEGTCLERFSRAVRAGYKGYRKSEGHNEYERLSTEQRWDKDLYMETLRELCWR